MMRMSECLHISINFYYTNLFEIRVRDEEDPQATVWEAKESKKFSIKERHLL